MATVLVTGASRGIGLATCLSLARAGHQVHATMRNPNAAADLDRFTETESLPITISAMDVDSDASVQEVVTRIGSIDALVNNAGIERRGAIEELDLEIFKAVMETNYFGAIRCIQAVLPGMRRQASGTIVNVTSVAGRLAAAPFAPYTASKFALEALSEVLAQEVKALGIRVAIVEPGIIDTDMARAITAGPQSETYPHARRMNALFAASLESAMGPAIVGDKIRDIIESESWQLRHPVGPDAEPFLGWRAALSDEQWADWGALNDDAWCEAVKRDFGLDVQLSS